MNATELLRAVIYNKGEMANGFADHHIATLVAYWQEHHDLKVDGQAGTLTQGSIDAQMKRLWDLELKEGPTLIGDDEQFSDGKWLYWDGPENEQPSQGEQVKYFGDPETSGGSNVMSKSWYRKNIIECHQSLGNRLPGAPIKQYVKVHRIVEPYLREALRRAKLVCPEYTIDRLGSYNFRHMGRDPKRSLSMHSFGAAVDVNPSDNSPARYSRGKAPTAYSDEYMARWPKGLPAAFVQAFTSCGWAWGSDWDEDGDTSDHTFLDPQHLEWVARDGVKLEV